MGSKPWQNLSALVLAGAALVGCNNTPQKTDNSIGATNGNPPWKTSQTAQQPPAPNFPVQPAQPGTSGFGTGQQPVQPVGIPNNTGLPPYGSVNGGNVTAPTNPMFPNTGNSNFPAGPNVPPSPTFGPYTPGGNAPPVSSTSRTTAVPDVSGNMPSIPAPPNFSRN